MKNIATRIFFTAGMIALVVVQAFAHPGHGLSGHEQEDLRHFISDPYHLPLSLALAGALMLAVLVLRKYRIRKKARR